MYNKKIVYLVLFVLEFLILLVVIPKVIKPLTDYPILPPTETQAATIPFTHIGSNHPYCAIDPTCINIASNNSGPYLAHLPSIAVSHTENTDKSALAGRNFAWPNYLAFLLLLIVLTSLITLIVRNNKVRIALLIIVTVWLVSEAGRWGTTMLGKGAYGLSLLMLLVSGAVLAGTWYLVRYCLGRSYEI